MVELFMPCDIRSEPESYLQVYVVPNFVEVVRNSVKWLHFCEILRNNPKQYEILRNSKKSWNNISDTLVIYCTKQKAHLLWNELIRQRKQKNGRSLKISILMANQIEKSRC